MIENKDVGPGWYWARKKGFKTVEIVEVWKDYTAWRTGDRGHHMRAHFDFLQRIDPPAWAESEFIESRDNDGA